MEVFITLAKAALFAWLIISLSSCPNEVNPPEPPPAGVLVKAYMGDTLAVDYGIRAVEGKNDIWLEWKPLENTSENVIEEYLIFRSNGPDSIFQLIAIQHVDGSSDDSTFQDANLKLDVLYSYFVVAKDTKHNFSDTSAYYRAVNRDKYIISFQLGAQVNGFYNPTSIANATTKPQFTWCLGSQPPIRYILKLGISEEQVIWVGYAQSSKFEADCNFPQNYERLTFNNLSYDIPSGNIGDSLFATAPLVKVLYINPAFFNGPRLKLNTDYLWRIDCVFGDNYASRSDWQPFTVDRQP